jgi:hypothetical protein
MPEIAPWKTSQLETLLCQLSGSSLSGLHALLKIKTLLGTQNKNAV